MGLPVQTSPRDDLRASSPPQAASRAGVDCIQRRIDSHDLLGAACEIEIVHGDHVYRLRRTSLGKLILTK